jgi:predicted ribosome quality control (RQC) complex YloA/Tae2 family protein
MNSLISQLDHESLPSKDDKNILAFEFNGFMIFVGRNALSNERVVKHHPHKECVWFHALGAKGSHVILCHSGSDESDFSDAAIRRAAELALKFSRSQARSVLYARLENVAKPPTGGVGVFHPTKTTQLDL